MTRIWRVRITLLTMFITAFVLQLVCVTAVYKSMWPDEYVQVMVKLFGIYSVHLSVILGAIFGGKPPDHAQPPRLLTPIAVALAALWNVLIGWRTVAFAFTAGEKVTDLIAYLDGVSAASAFLVTGLLTTYFIKANQ